MVSREAAFFQAVKRLQDNKNDQALLEARILLFHALNISYEEWVKNPKSQITKNQEAQYKSYIDRRIKNEPIAYIVGTKEFFGLDFKVTTDVLIPRPDSETLIEAVKDYFSIEDSQDLKTLEVGVGSGCLLISLLSLYKKMHGIGVDVSQKAVSIAYQNAVHHKVDDRCEIHQSNWLENVKMDLFDIIISNPPYISLSDKMSLSEDILHYEPHIALFSKENGLQSYKIIASLVSPFLKKDGYIFLEIGKGQEEDVAKIFLKQGFDLVDIKKDIHSILRCIIFKKKS